MNQRRAGVSRAQRLCVAAWDAVQRHRIRAAALVGIGICLARVLTDLLAVPIDLITLSAVQLSFCLLLLGLLCWPLTSYKLAFRLALAATIALGFSGTINALLRWPDNIRLVPWFVPVGVVAACALISAVAFAFLSGLVFVRMRYWPVYPPGHCERCGYNLFALQSARCPECGTPFLSKKTLEEDMRQQEAGPREDGLSQQRSCAERIVSNPNDGSR